MNPSMKPSMAPSMALSMAPSMPHSMAHSVAHSVAAAMTHCIAPPTVPDRSPAQGRRTLALARRAAGQALVATLLATLLATLASGQAAAQATGPATPQPLAAAAGAAPARPATAPPPDDDCVLHYEVTPRYDTTPRALEVTLRFPAQARTRSMLRWIAEWAGVTDFAAAVRGLRGGADGVRVALADLPNRWSVDHPAGGEVVVHYAIPAALPDPDAAQPQDDFQMYRAQVGAQWFQAFGYALLPTVETWDDRARVAQCLTLHQPEHTQALAFGSLGHGTGTVRWRVVDSPQALRHAFYGGGPGWRVGLHPVAGGLVGVAVRGTHPVTDADFSDAALALIGAHRRFWGDARADDQWLVLTPNHTRGNMGGTLVNRVAVMNVHPGFQPREGGMDFLVAHENLHQWIPRRFGRRSGPTAEDPGRTDYWFSEGFTDYYTHRLLLQSGQWSLDRYASELTRVLRRHWLSPAREAPSASLLPRFFSDRDAGQQFYSRGELLAMRWDRALREAGHPGLDAALRQALLPADRLAPEDAPLAASTPSGVDRVLAALAPVLGDLPRRDLEAHIGRGRPLPLDEGLAGPCFQLRWRDEARWVSGFDLQASLQARAATGVVPGGPAHAAGLRNGIPLLGWSVYSGDVTRPIELTLPALPTPDAATPALRLNFRPVDGSVDRLPRLSVAPGAAERPDCVAWQRRAGPPT